MTLIQLAISLICIFIGARMSGLGFAAAAALQAAGCMDYQADVAGKILGPITIPGLLVTDAFLLFAGTDRISHSINPIIAEVTINNRIPPDRAIHKSVRSPHMIMSAILSRRPRIVPATASVLNNLLRQSVLC